MADPFEDKLAAMFAEAPAFPDEAGFTASVERRLARRALVRRAWLWGAGAVGAAIAVGQGFATGLGDRIVGLGGGVMQDLSTLAGAGDGGVNGAPTIGAIALALSILALAVIGLRAAEA